MAQNHVFNIKRYDHPELKSEHLTLFETPQILDLSELRQQALKTRTVFNYDAPLPGLRADRYRFEVRLAEPLPRPASPTSTRRTWICRKRLAWDLCGTRLRRIGGGVWPRARSWKAADVAQGTPNVPAVTTPVFQCAELTSF